MKKCWLVLALALLLTGCGAQETFETISDEYAAPAVALVRKIQVVLPADTAMVTVKNEDGSAAYLWENCTITTQTLAGGDLNRTVKAVTGYEKDALTLIKREQGACQRYDFVWTCAGETGDQVGRAAILDDGSYHYVLTAMAPAGEEQDWETIFASFGAA